MNPTAHATFLLGSGISIPSGYPSTAEITAKLLSRNWLEALDQSKLGIPLTSVGVGQEYWAKAEATFRLIRLLRNHVDQHLALYGHAEASYEDIYFLGQQLLDSLRGEYDNPGLLPWLMDLRSKLSTLDADVDPIFKLGGKPNWHESEKLSGLVERCLEHIQEAVATQLVLRKRKRGLRLLNEFLSASRPSPLRVATLNHDTLLDRFFAKKKVLDGFRSFSQGTEIFDPACFETEDAFRVQLLKLHGSIDWFRYKSTNGDDLAIRVKNGDRDHIKDDAGHDLFRPTGRLLLAGTTNKELAYGSGIFLELMFQFHRLLRDTNLLIVSGYGFGDKGINNRIWAWLEARPENRMIILHARPDELRQNAKPSFAHNMDRHKDAKKFALVGKWMSDCSLEDLIRDPEPQRRLPAQQPTTGD